MKHWEVLLMLLGIIDLFKSNSNSNNNKEIYMIKGHKQLKYKVHKIQLHHL